MLNVKLKQVVQRDYGMAGRNPLKVCPPPCKTESGELVDWAVTTDQERQDHFKTVDEHNDFLQGQQDCQQGIAHESGKGEAYDQGYGNQYEYEQILSQEEK